MESTFNPDINTGTGIFGLPHTAEESLIHIIPVPWDLTTSYGGGTARGPKAVFNASFQLDLYQEPTPSFWKEGIFLLPEENQLINLNQSLHDDAKRVVDSFSNNIQPDSEIQSCLERVNNACEVMNNHVYNQARAIIAAEKIPFVLGGDHSSPLGLIKALSEHHLSFGLLHIDAHTDLRKAYQGFTHSHASIMYNVFQIEQVSKMVQVGTRDYCTEENRRIQNAHGRIVAFNDRYIQHEQFQGRCWDEIVTEITEDLPSKVYVSFDIDGLDPSNCPNTGTPVPGGLTFNQATYLLESIVCSGRKIIGADLCEVAPDKSGNTEWDANVGARILMQLCLHTITSNSR